MTKTLPEIPEGDRFADVLKFRRLGGSGHVLYECWDEAVHAYAAAAVAAERERCARVVENYCGAWDETATILASIIRRGPSPGVDIDAVHRLTAPKP